MSSAGVTPAKVLPNGSSSSKPAVASNSFNSSGPPAKTDLVNGSSSSSPVAKPKLTMSKQNSPKRKPSVQAKTSTPALRRQMTHGSAFDDATFKFIVKAERAAETSRRLRRVKAMQRSSAVIDPRTSTWVPLWDALMLITILFVAVVTPVEVAFFADARHVDALWVVNRGVDVIFTADILFNFNLSFQEPPSRGAYWVLNRSMIAQRYLRTWALVDVLSVLPWWALTFDWVGSDTSSGSRAAVLFRVVKLLRLLRLARVLKAGVSSGSPIHRYIIDVATSRWELTYAVIQMVQLIVSLCFYSHWQACAWGLFSSYMQDDGYPNWIGSFDQAHEETFGVPARPLDHYVAAFYWSMMTVTGIGYGEMLPINTTERFLCTLWMFISGVVWTYAIGTVAMIATTLDPNGVAFHNTMDSLNFFMRERDLPRHMRMMLREYFTSARHVHQLNDDSKLISMMSPMIEGEVAVVTNRRWLQRVWYFRNLDSNMEGRYFIVALAKKLVIRAYVATERLPIGQLYILRRGLCVKMWRFLGGGNTWGEDIIIDNAELIDHSQAVALTYVECFTLRRNDMEEALVESPAVQHVVQKAARKLSLQRALIQELVQRGQGRAPMSFATQSASHGYTTVSKSLTIEQKLDEISGRLRAFERHGRRERERSMADCVQPAVMEVTVTDVAEPPRETPISKQRGASESGSESGGALATGQEVSELKAVVLEMRSTMMSELKAMRELISATGAGT